MNIIQLRHYPTEILIFNNDKIIGSFPTNGAITGNCKVTALPSFAVYLRELRRKNDEDTFKSVLQAIKEQFVSIFVTTNNLNDYQVYLEYFDIYYCIMVPIGYGNGNQWHILLKCGDQYNNQGRPAEVINLFQGNKKKILLTQKNNYK